MSVKRQVKRMPKIPVSMKRDVRRKDNRSMKRKTEKSWQQVGKTRGENSN